MFNSDIIIFVPLSTSLSLLSCMSTILFPFILPSFIIVVVDIMLSTSFCAVPAFIRELPVINSGPTTTSIGNCDAKLKGHCLFDVIHPVVIPSKLHVLSADITYGVVPDAAIPITTSLSVTLYFVRSFHPWVVESSANSTASLIALSPPAIIYNS